MASSTLTSPQRPVTLTQRGDSFREMIESIVIACILAFLFRTYLAEAFVIPTGSMAPTLMGRHKEIKCPECGTIYTVGASDELERKAELLVQRIHESVCPNCRALNSIYDENVFRGDRILVNKFPYEIGAPQRWDVFVFRYPEDPQINYIKRLVALPGEEVQIRRGDVSVRKGEADKFEILRKDDPNKQLSLQQLVYDDRHPPTRLIKAGWPERWAPMQRATTAPPDSSNSNNAVADSPVWSEQQTGSWQRQTGERAYSLPATPELSWLRYRHFVPSSIDWSMASEGLQLKAGATPQLISDFCGYNSSDQGRDGDGLWVGDLTLSFRLDVDQLSGPQSQVVVELVEGVRVYRCTVDLQTGEAVLSRNNELQAGPGEEIVLARLSTPLRQTGSHEVTFANVDDRLCLWVDGRLLPTKEAEYIAPGNPNPQVADLSPAAIAVRGAQARVANLMLQRDIYYTAVSTDLVRADRSEAVFQQGGGGLHTLLSNPSAWSEAYNRTERSVSFAALSEDEFFALGDNSPRSADSRLWDNRRKAPRRHAVPRSALLGKAFFIYWPHGVPFGNDGRGWPVWYHRLAPDTQPEDNYPLVTAPFYPYVSRMERIR